jgi:hypothetical protein
MRKIPRCAGRSYGLPHRSLNCIVYLLLCAGGVTYGYRENFMIKHLSIASRPSVPTPDLADSLQRRQEFLEYGSLKRKNIFSIGVESLLLLCVLTKIGAGRN